MFDHIGTDPDEEARRRRAVAGAWATLGVGAVVALVVAAGTWWVTEAPALAPLPAFVELAEPEPELPDEPPPGLPSRPPGPPASGGGAPDEAPAPPEVPPDDPAPLDAVVAPHVVDTARGGPGDGPPGDGPPGDGPPGGGGGGGGGDGSGGPRTVHATDLRSKRRVEPEYPDAARALGLGQQRCVARVEISAEGQPTHVEVAQCPAVFHRETEEALLQWRWYPVRLGAERIPVVTTISVVYRLD